MSSESKLKPSVDKVLTKLLKNVDEPVMEYLAAVICETPKSIKDDSVMHAAIGDLLLAYDIAGSDAECEALCRKLAKEIGNITGLNKPAAGADAKADAKSIVAAVAAADSKAAKATPASTGGGRDDKSDSKDSKSAPASSSAAAVGGAKKSGTKQQSNTWEVANDSTRHLIRVGMHVLAKYDDGNWYDAVVERFKGNNFGVTFTGYGNEEEVELGGIKLIRADSNDDFQLKLLSAPIKIGDFGIVIRRDEDEEDRKAAGGKGGAAGKSDVPAGPTKKELRKLKEEKKKQDMLLRKEKERRARAKAIKMNAVHMYLASDQKRAKDVAVELFSLHTPDGSTELLLDQALRFTTGRRYGLIGRNGAGKTSLLRAIATYDIAGFPTHLRVIHVEQEVKGTNTSIIDRVLKADVERTMLMAEEKKLLSTIDEKDKAHKDEKLDAAARTAAETESKVAAKRLEKVYSRMKEIDAWTAEARAASILSGLGFAIDKQKAPTKELSGGWRMRVALACALFVHPDILLLDEPTNHLDFPAVLWLEDYLKKYKNTLILVSHDRHFVNNVITDVIHLHQKQLVYYRGDYDTYERVRIEKMQAQKKQFEAQKLKREHTQKFIDKFRYNAKRAALVQSRIKSLARMELLEDVMQDPAFHFEFPDPEPLAQSAVVCSAVTFGYSKDKILMTDVHCNIDMNSRIGVLGANGVGKSTLIKLLTGDIEPLEGKIVRNASARIATFAQHHMDQLKLALSPLDLMMETFPKNHPQVMRRHLGLFGITGDLALQRIEYLSGGQKSRVAFALVTWKKPHIIIMDEPTNHLDLETIDALILAINGFGGGVLLVSHDQHFLSHVGQEFWGLANGKVKRFDDFEQTKKFSYGDTKFNS